MIVHMEMDNCSHVGHYWYKLSLSVVSTDSCLLFSEFFPYFPCYFPKYFPHIFPHYPLQKLHFSVDIKRTIFFIYCIQSVAFFQVPLMFHQEFCGSG